MLMLPADASMQEVAQLRQKLGFNDPLYVRTGGSSQGRAG